MQSSTTVPPESSVNTAPHKQGVLRSLGLGLITGAADDDPSAIGTYASAGAAIGPGFLWTAPLTFPMMVAVVYLSSKLGQVSGEGLFAVLRKNYAKWIYYPALIGILVGNTIEAVADIGGMGAALHLLIPIPVAVILVAIAGLILALQIWGSYTLIRDIFRWLALVLLAYVTAAFLAKPDWGPVLRGTFIPHIRFTKDFLCLLVAVIGTTMSAYLYTWQSNEEVEEKIALGKRYSWQRRGTAKEAVNTTKWDVISGMFFSNVVMYFIILATAATLFKVGHTEVNSAAEAAEALRPLAGDAGKWLFALGVVGVGFLAVPVMTIVAAYDLSQTMGWRHGLSKRPGDAKLFYGAIVGFTLIALGINFIGINPMKALVWAGVIQGFSTPPLLLLILLMTNNRKIMGKWVNSRATNVLGWATTLVIFAATLGLVVSWFV
jgi:NRAMP (natural resistance-associated macrophage protein)-like metal ion transporter